MDYSFYPFQELDFLTRENGLECFELMLNSPNEQAYLQFKEALNCTAPELIRTSFDRTLYDIATSGGNRTTQISQVLNICFDNAFWVIKRCWWKFGIKNKKAYKKQVEHNLELVNQVVYESPIWVTYRAVYQTACQLFRERVIRNLVGYAELDRPTTVITLNNQDSKPNRTGFDLNCNPKDKDHIVHLLYERLKNPPPQSINALVASDTQAQEIINAFSGGEIQKKIIWLGSLLQLRYFITRLSEDNMIKPCSNKWVVTADLFSVFDPKTKEIREYTSNQIRHCTKELSDKGKLPIEWVIRVIEDPNVGDKRYTSVRFRTYNEG